MQQTQFSQDAQTISLFQKRLFVFFSSFVLALAQLGLLLFVWQAIHRLNLPLYYTDTLIPFGLQALLYFLIPIPVSLYLSQAGKRQDGNSAGRTIGCIGAILAMLFEIIALLVIPLIGLGYGGYYNLPELDLFKLISAFTIFSFFYVFLALVGAILGSFIGTILRKKRKNTLLTF